MICCTNANSTATATFIYFLQRNNIYECQQQKQTSSCRLFKMCYVVSVFVQRFQVYLSAQSFTDLESDSTAVDWLRLQKEPTLATHYIVAGFVQSVCRRWALSPAQTQARRSYDISRTSSCNASHCRWICLKVLSGHSVVHRHSVWKLCTGSEIFWNVFTFQGKN